MEVGMKIIVDEVPTKPHDCLFAKVSWSDANVIPNCFFRCRKSSLDALETFSRVPNSHTCVLAADEKCPFLKSERLF